MAYTTPFNTLASSSGSGVQLSNVGLAVYSAELLFSAQPILRFDQIVTEKTELGVQPGASITFVKYSPVTGSSALTEGVAIVPTTLSTSYVTITVAEHAKAVSVTELRLRTAFTDVMSDTAKLLGRHYAVDYDSRVRDVLESGSNVLYSGAKASRAVLTASDTMNIELVKEAVEQMATAKVPKFGGDAYICYLHPHQARGLRDDPEWISARNYAGPDAILKGEIGRFEDVRFIETTLCIKVLTTGDKYSDGADTGADESTYNVSVPTYKAYIVGDHVIGHAEALPVELRDNGVEDFGRLRSLGWYSIDGLGFIETGHAYTLESA